MRNFVEHGVDQLGGFVTRQAHLLIDGFGQSVRV